MSHSSVLGEKGNGGHDTWGMLELPDESFAHVEGMTLSAVEEVSV